MKKYLVIALAALGFAACAENQEDINNPVLGGEVEESYIAINLMSADLDTRAATDSYGYEEGTTEERAIKSAYFFFFDENGNPFNVLGAPATAPGGEKNHLPLTISDATTSGMPNVSDIKNAVLVLSTYKGIYPKQIVAVLNWVPQANTYTLEGLHNELSTIGNDTDGYVMSNSVYMDGANKVVDAVALSEANIKTSEAEALAHPVEIYVERVAAKVVVTANTNNIYQVTEESALKPVGGSSITAYVRLLGWELYNDYNNSTLLKNIENWDVATLGLTWNDIPYYRCYWADASRASFNDSFAWSYENGGNTSYGINVGAATYCGENTNGNADLRTKVIIKGQLVQKNGANYEPLELARWYGNEYIGQANLKIAVANSLKYTLYYKDGEGHSSIRPEDLECVAGVAGTEAYEVGFQLSNAGKAKEWYLYSSAGGYQALGDKAVAGDNVAKTNAHLAGVEPALLYTSGQTYYFVDIEHLGTAAAKYGVVRNHVYQIDIKSIKGYGSPVYNGLSNIVTPPDYPEDEDEASYVAAKINILSWKVVKQGVNIGQ